LAGLLGLLPAPVIAEVDTGAPVEELIARLEGASSASWPSFAPDGKHVAYVSTAGSVPQVRIANLDDPSADYPLTSFKDPVTGVQWSPTGNVLAASIAPDGGMNSQIYLLDPGGGEPTRITRGGRDNNHLGAWSSDGRLYTYSSNADDSAVLEPYAYDLATRSTQRLSPGRGVAFASDFSADSTRLILERARSRGDNNISILDLRTGEEMLLTPHEGQATFGFAWFAGSGNEVVMSSNAGSDRAGLASVRLEADSRPGTVAQQLVRDDAELELVVLNHQQDRLLLSWNNHGRSELWLAGIDGARPEAVAGLPGDVVSGADFSPDGRRIAIAVSGAHSPSAIYVYDLECRQFNRISHPASDAGFPPLVAPRLERFTAHDGLPLSGWLYVPAGSKGPWPTAVFFHGGPEGQARPFFSALYQALLARGIAVFDPNVRGSSGFGQHFMDLDNGALRWDAIHDIESTVRFLVDAGVVQRGRIGIAGASYGGYMTMSGLTQYPELFAAGANIFGVVNFESFFAGTEQWIASISTREYGDPVTQAAMLRSLSPIHQVERIRAPVIVLHGAADTNVPVGEAEQLVRGLQRRNLPVEFVHFPNEGHGFLRLENRIRAAAAIVSWFERYVAQASLE
jgi:dipeptidyl aminopeptidase/acylaminoacyl peptidase